MLEQLLKKNNVYLTLPKTFNHQMQKNWQQNRKETASIL